MTKTENKTETKIDDITNARPIIEGPALAGFRALRDRFNQRREEMAANLAKFKAGGAASPEVEGLLNIYSTMLEMFVKDLDALFGGDK